MADGDGQIAAGESSSIKSKEASKQRRGILSRIWNGIFRRRGEDFEKRLQYLSKEETSVHARIKRRTQSWRRIARYIVIGSVFLELAAVIYAITKTRSSNLDWKERAVTVLPIFIMPGLSTAIYSVYARFIRMCERNDQKTLERLRAERQAKIDELKERTNYYLTQQLIQRFDTDPAAKAAAATVLASKLGADSGLKVLIGDESKLNAPVGKSSDAEFVQSNNGLRNRKQSHARRNSTESVITHHFVEEMPNSFTLDGQEPDEHDQPLVVEHHQSSTGKDVGWIARIAAMLVGEDPAQSYALICGNCHMHNGLARKEDFPFITYYCPHCHALNGSRQSEEQGSSSNPGKASVAPLPTGDSGSSGVSVSESEVVSSSKGTVSGTEEVSEEGKDSSAQAN